MEWAYTQREHTTTLILARPALSFPGTSFSKVVALIGLLSLWVLCLLVRGLLVDQNTSDCLSNPVSVTVTNGEASKQSFPASCKRQCQEVQIISSLPVSIEELAVFLRFNFQRRLQWHLVFLSIDSMVKSRKKKRSMDSIPTQHASKVWRSTYNRLRLSNCKTFKKHCPNTASKETYNCEDSILILKYLFTTYHMNSKS